MENVFASLHNSPGFEYRLLSVQIQKLFIGWNTALASLPLGIISLLIWYIWHQVVSGVALCSDFYKRWNMEFLDTLLSAWCIVIKTSFLPFKVKWSYFFFNSRGLLNKENIPSGFSSLDECMLNACEVEKLYENTSGYIGERGKPKRQKSSSKLSELNENQDGLVVSAWFYKIFTCSQLGNTTSLFHAL